MGTASRPSSRCLVCGDAGASVILTHAHATVLRCAHCGLVYVDPLPGEDELRSLYLGYDVGEGEPAFASQLAGTRKARVREGGPPEGVALPRDEIYLRDRGALHRGRLPVYWGPSLVVLAVKP